MGIVILLLIPTSGGRGSGLSSDLGHIAVLVVLFALGFVSWLVTRWRVQDGVLRVESGLLRRTSERFPLSRIQAIDTVRPGLARVFGLAELRIRLASGSGKAGRLAYLTNAEAETLRARLLEMSRGPAAPEGAAGAAMDAPGDTAALGAGARAGGTAPAPERLLVTVAPARLLASLLLTGSGLGLELAIVALAVLAVIAPGVAAAVFGSEAIVVVGLGAGLFRRFNGDYRLTVADTADGLRLRSGLVETSAETIPRGRIQAIRMVEPLAWRLCGWCRLEVDVASQKSKGRQDRNQAKAGRALLPVGTREEAASLLASVFPGLPQERLAPPSRARWKSPLRFRHLSWGANDRYAVTTSGRIRRVTDWVPLAKVQSIRLLEGPLQRPLELSSIHLDTAGRNVRAVARDRDRAEAAALMRELPERCREAR
jgi:putative membrane protein